MTALLHVLAKYLADIALESEGDYAVASSQTTGLLVGRCRDPEII